MESLGLYLHFPFCVRKCRYCDFLSFPSSDDEKRLYASALVREIRLSGEMGRGFQVDSIFLGGGTPSVMPPSALAAVMRAVHDTFCVSPEAEITMEMNPGTVTERLLPFISDSLSRVSLGVQSADDGELASLGRIHSFDDAAAAAELLRSAGIRNLNIDLMSGIPGQTLKSWERSLLAAVSLEPEHISAYSLMVEEGTPFMDLFRRGLLSLPDEETERRMYAATEEILGRNGYSRYEISNYARPGFECRHNIRYWTRAPYLGFGLGASSFFSGNRWKNTDSMKEYLSFGSDVRKLWRDAESISPSGAVEEYMFLGLRMMRGISEADFRKIFGMTVREVYGDVPDQLISEGLLVTEEKDGDVRLKLTARGIDVSNAVLAEFLLD